jgi:hypothetical protein
MHGHEVDPFNKDLFPGWGNMLTIFAGIYKDAHKSPVVRAETVDRYLEGLGEKMLWIWNLFARILRPGTRMPQEALSHLTPSQRRSRIREHIELVRQNLIQEKYDVAITGHTHCPGQYENWYFNAGSWCESDATYLLISSQGDIKVLHWNGENAPVRQQMITLPPKRKVRF